MRSDATSPPFAKGTATRQRILDAAVARFASQGFRDTTVAAVARDAGVTAPAVHAYFGSKQELFHAAFEYDVTPVLEALYGGGGPCRTLALDSTAARHESRPSSPCIRWRCGCWRETSPSTPPT